VSPADHPVSQYEFDVLIGADGKRNTLDGEFHYFLTSTTSHEGHKLIILKLTFRHRSSSI